MGAVPARPPVENGRALGIYSSPDRRHGPARLFVNEPRSQPYLHPGATPIATGEGSAPDRPCGELLDVNVAPSHHEQMAHLYRRIQRVADASYVRLGSRNFPICIPTATQGGTGSPMSSFMFFSTRNRGYGVACRRRHYRGPPRSQDFAPAPRPMAEVNYLTFSLIFARPSVSLPPSRSPTALGWASHGCCWRCWWPVDTKWRTRASGKHQQQLSPRPPTGM